MEGNEEREIPEACDELKPWWAARVYAGRRKRGARRPRVSRMTQSQASLYSSPSLILIH